ncbi:hypothetical protein IWQ61_008221 [Dispira simplex]|nr:hypothetical protein IWQ61_008221 [Dispira simplex]
MQSSNFLRKSASFMSDSGTSTLLSGRGVKHFNDPVHGYISFGPFMLDIIDTPQFQRLRYLKQMGTSYFVFPGASHNRFEHCLGVGYLAGNLITRFQETQPELAITERELRCIQVAGLCHDLGHGPFSHVFDSIIIPTLMPGSTWTHEQGSEMMFNYLVDDNYIDLEPDEVSLVNDLILCRRPTSSAMEKRQFLFDIVANQRNGLDVDRFDYISRDCYNVGLKSSYDSSRLMLASRVINDEVCYHNKEVYNIYDMYHTRYSLFKRIYTHRVAVAVETMLVDALLMAAPYLGILEALQDPAQYLYLTDDILRDVERSQSPELAEARELLKRMRCRQLYKFVDEFIIPGKLRDRLSEKNINAAAIVAHQEDNAHLTKRDVVVKWHQLNYGKKNLNPVDSVRFFSKFNDYSSFPISKESVSYLIPAQFSEVAIRVYARDFTKIKEIQQAFWRLMREWRCQPDSPDIALVANQGHSVPLDYESPRKRRLVFTDSH